jgi:2',3'-cyclic-nucleotide 2'-phosphodiesterase (5'-nucleotidase family)
MKDGAGSEKTLGVAGRFLLDAGDTFLPSHRVPEGDRPRWEATAPFIIERFNSHGLDAMTLGDRDLGLGLERLLALKAAAKFPIIASNLTRTPDGSHPFVPFAVLEKAGVKVAFVGLMSEKRVTPHAEAFARDGLAVRPAAMALADLKDRINAAQPAFWVVLSQLLPDEEAELARLFPEIRLFVGGDGMGMSPDPMPAGSAWSCQAGQKGKQVVAVTVDLQASGGPNTPWVVGDARGRITRRIEQARSRIEQLSKQLERLTTGAAPQPTPPVAQPGQPDPARLSEVRRRQIENQIASAKTELQVAEQELASVPADGGGPANTLEMHVFQMSREVPDDPAEAEAVKAFRARWPAEPGH